MKGIICLYCMRSSISIASQNYPLVHSKLFIVDSDEIEQRSGGFVCQLVLWPKVPIGYVSTSSVSICFAALSLHRSFAPIRAIKSPSSSGFSTSEPCGITNRMTLTISSGHSFSRAFCKQTFFGTFRLYRPKM